MKISYSAPAKVILSGEHAVVYGKPALVSAINLRLKFDLFESEVKTKDKNILLISSKVKKYLEKEKIIFKDKMFDFKIESEIPVGRGLGSSAALSVTAVASFLEFYTGLKFEKETVNNLAFQVEKHFHQNPSGVDNSAVCFGGLILYKKRIQLTNLNYKIPESFEEKLLLIDSGQPKESTGEMVKLVESVELVKPTKIIFNKIEIETKKMLKAIEKENIEQLKESIVINEKLLEEIGVVSEKTKKLLEDFNKFGSGKVTGAGGLKTGSGFILFFAGNKIGLKDFLKTNKIKYYQFMPDYQGLKRI
ncbi:MAG: mevalonate kinase [Patescibacteria group bacterium]|jgi:mevalonate kinase